LTEQKVLQRKAIEDVVTLVINSDNSQDFMIDAEELDEICLGLSVIEDLNFDEDLFREEVEGLSEISLGTILSVVRPMVEQVDSEEE